MANRKKAVPAKQAVNTQQEAAILCMTDLHYGKKTDSFNQDIFEQEILRLTETMQSRREEFAGRNITELVCCILGDINDGSEIYPTQPHHQVETNVEVQAEEITEILTPFFQKMKEVWGNVRIETVPGNHGRSGRFAHDFASWDTVTYKYLRGKLASDDIKVGINKGGTNPFLRKVNVLGHNYLMYHGHDIKMFQGIPWYGIWNRVAKWATTSTLSPFEVIMMGHFHSFADNTLNKIRILTNGTMITDDDWALQVLGRESDNKWHLFGVTKDKAVDWQYPVDLVTGGGH